MWRSVKAPSAAWEAALRESVRDGYLNPALLFYRVFRFNVGEDCSVILDVGCGRGANVVSRDTEKLALYDLRPLATRVVGIDVDPRAADNPRLHEFRLIGPDGRWPIDDASVDAAISDWVVEHVEDPDLFLSELRRVLRPGGVFGFRTVSKHSAPAVGARLVPNRLHARVLGRLQPGRESRDVFPTAYRLNSLTDIDRACRRAGLRVECMTLPGTYTYLPRTPRLATLTRSFERRLPESLRHTIIALGWAV